MQQAEINKWPQGFPNQVLSWTNNSRGMLIAIQDRVFNTYWYTCSDEYLIAIFVKKKNYYAEQANYISYSKKINGAFGTLLYGYCRQFFYFV